MQPKCILLDIEGTTSSISFVYDVMFPYVRKHLVTFLEQNWNAASVQDCLPLLAQDMSLSADNWLDDDAAAVREQVKSAVIQLMDDDIKATGLKKLQGAIWKSGFESGQLVAHLFDDVADSIRQWKQAGICLFIYSSGSVEAQTLFFGHSVAGNLLPMINGHYDTAVGSKKEPNSYLAIAADANMAPSEFVFVSDVTDELEAAKAAGMNTILSLRPGNKPVQNAAEYYCIRSFEEIDFSRICV